MREDVRGHWEIRPHNRRRPITAWRAMKRLQQDGEETGEVFKIIEALKGPALSRNTERFRATPDGPAMLAEKRDLVNILEDREALRQLPPESLGATYLRFVEAENLTADGLEAATLEAPKQGARNQDEIWFAERQRATHDLFHVATGYGRDGLGEIALLEFDCTQTKNLGIRYILWMSGRTSKKEGRWPHVAPVMEEAKALAGEAEWLIAQDWEALLPLPLAEVRRRLKLREPSAYKAVKAQFPDEKHPQTQYEIAAE